MTETDTNHITQRQQHKEMKREDRGKDRYVGRGGERVSWTRLGKRTACSVSAIEDKVIQGLLSCLIGYSGGFCGVIRSSEGMVEGGPCSLHVCYVYACDVSCQ